MNASTVQLVRKELRSLTPLYAATAVLIVIGMTAVTYEGNAHLTWAASVAGCVAALAGAATFAGEKESGTIHFLIALPMDRSKIFKIKTIHTAVVPLVLLMVTLLVSFFFAHPFGDIWPWAFLWAILLPIWFYSFGLLLSVLMDTVIIAALAGTAAACVAAVPVIILFTYAFTDFDAAHVAEPVANGNALGFPLSGALYLAAGLLLVLAIPVAAVWLARRLFCGRFRPARGAE